MEAGGSRSKRGRSVSPSKDEDGGGVDHISALPDAILGEIITLLPTKDGARTRILASRWRHLWRSAPLNLQGRSLINHPDKRGKFAGVVSRILSSHQGPGRRFCIPDGHGRSIYGAATTMDAWLRSPALDNLQELDVWYDRCHQVPASTFRFSATLRVLAIGGCDLSKSSTVQGLGFPVLKQLGIECVIISESSIHSLIASCPVLECLSITYTYGFSCLRINSHSIKKIHIYGCGTDEPEQTDPIELKELIIESAPCLEILQDICNDGLHASIVSAPKLETLGILNEHKRDGVDYSTRLVFGSTVIQVGSTSEEFIAEQKKKLQFDNRASRVAQFRFTTGVAVQV
ncbi:putative F-box/FBD/LRR-repeat protein At1g66290 [Lolium rigidum]|uniref:putative F-box/FBD/LRR-repeat protein At1g66290 n=1 Tax=Lolium rigidum TaxID=89674 RepID=UPI001F5C0B2A|nr:putative F-box/FBD/LRR-repeat protein At1g66290 [Lolium rigidum]